MNASDLQDPDQWEGVGAVTPPTQWEFIAADERWWWVYSSAEGSITFLGEDPVLTSEDAVCHWEVTEILGNPATTIDITIGDLAVQSVDGTQVGSGSFAVPAGTSITTINAESNLGGMYDATIALNFTGTDGCPSTGGGPSDADGFNYNCSCPDNDNETLAELRQRMLIRLGFAAVASNPPPGMASLIDQFLITQNRLMYHKYPALRTRRLFKWVMEEGGRFYGIRDNEQAQDLTKYFDVTKPIEGVYLRDLNGAWLPMTAGIPPTFYTTVMNNAIPWRYEIRSCIEVFPAPPADGYELWIKAQQTPDAFAVDADQTTVSSELVFLQALADALDYYGKPSAQGVYKRANELLGELVASTHTTKRYVPGSRDIPPWTVPVYAPWPGEY